MKRIYRRGMAGLIVMAGALALSACLLTPGRFTSALDIRKDGRFSFSYSGEIRMLALSKLAEKDAATKAEFVETPCHDDDLKDRACTAGELGEQKRAWAEEQPNGTATVLPSITMKTATGEILMGWLASRTDMLAEDWVLVE